MSVSQMGKLASLSVGDSEVLQVLHKSQIAIIPQYVLVFDAY